MDKMIAFCGITCTECPTFLAMKEDDDNERAKVAELWSKKFNVEIKSEQSLLLNKSGEVVRPPFSGQHFQESLQLL